MAKYLLSLSEFGVQREFRTPASVSTGDEMEIILGGASLYLKVRKVTHKVDRDFVQIHLEAEPGSNGGREVQKGLLEDGWSKWGETPLEHSS